MARLAEAQLVQDGTYPNAAAVFAEVGAVSTGSSSTLDFDPAQPRDLWGRWTSGGAGAAAATTTTTSQSAQQTGGLSWLLSQLNPIGAAQAQEIPPEPPGRREAEPAESGELQPGETMRVERFNQAWEALKKLDPKSRALEFLRAAGSLPTEAEIEILERAAREIIAARTCSPLNPAGLPDEPIAEPPRSDPFGSDVLRPNLPRVDPRASQQLDNALNDYQTRRYQIGNQVFQLTKRVCGTFWSDILSISGTAEAKRFRPSSVRERASMMSRRSLAMS